MPQAICTSGCHQEATIPTPEGRQLLSNNVHGCEPGSSCHSQTCSWAGPASVVSPCPVHPGGVRLPGTQRLTQRSVNVW